MTQKKKKTITTIIKTGSSETTRVTSTKSTDFHHYLAGLIDGDGCFTISKAGGVSLEITLHENDTSVLDFIKEYCSFGAVKKRPGVKAFRFRVYRKKSIRTLLSMLNGKLCTPEKISQFTKVCALHDVPLRCGSVKRDTSWFAGFVDAEGYFSIRNKNTLTLSVGQKNKKILQDIKSAFSLGNIYFDKSWDGYNWCITNLPGIKEMNQYFKKFPLKTD